jgi:hypothetical protein
MTREPNFAALLEKFFIQRLMHQRQASAHTIAWYRDTFRLLLELVQRHRKVAGFRPQLQTNPNRPDFPKLQGRFLPG